MIKKSCFKIYLHIIPDQLWHSILWKGLDNHVPLETILLTFSQGVESKNPTVSMISLSLNISLTSH